MLKLLLLSSKKATLKIFSLYAIKKILIVLIILYPTTLLLSYLEGYTSILFSSLFIIKYLYLLYKFFVSREDKYISNIWENCIYSFINYIFMLVLMDIINSLGFKLMHFLRNEETSGSENSLYKSDGGESNPNGSNQNFNHNIPDNATDPSQGDYFIYVQTTLPVNEGELPIIHTDRLILRAPKYSDLDAYYSLRTQPEAMTDSGRGLPDDNLSVTLNKLTRLINKDKDSLYFFIFEKNPDGSEGALIGDGGVHNFKSESTGWPEFGYKFKKEYWGQGYATEFGKAFIKFWGNQPRKDVEIPVAPSSVDYTDNLQVKERLTAYTRNENLASKNVLLKLGFQSFKGLKNGLINWRKIF